MIQCIGRETDRRFSMNARVAPSNKTTEQMDFLRPEKAAANSS